MILSRLVTVRHYELATLPAIVLLRSSALKAMCAASGLMRKLRSLPMSRLCADGSWKRSKAR